jgi:hypothetical protein
LVPNSKLLIVAERGPGPARNAGVASTTSDLLAFLDADCVAATDWIEQLKRANQIAPNAVLGGDVRIGPDSPATLTACYEAVYAFRTDRYLSTHGFALTANMAVPRTILEKVGPFGGLEIAEDRDWGRRAQAMGVVQDYVPEIRVFHPARPNLSSLRAKWDRMLAHDHREQTATLTGAARWCVKTVLMPASPIAELPRLAFTPRLSSVGQRIKSFAGLCMIRWHRAHRMAILMLRPSQAALLAARWNST